MVSNLMPGMASPEPPTKWSETAMKHDYVDVAEHFRNWRDRYKDEMPSPEFEAIVSLVENAIDTLDDAMDGDL